LLELLDVVGAQSLSAARYDAPAPHDERLDDAWVVTRRCYIVEGTQEP
jgi:hypothetical protein